jgi:hypothetical protein
VTEAPLRKDSPVLHALYELAVPLWPLIHWVTFRAAANDRTDLLPSFLGILRGPDKDLFAWDNEDDLGLYLEFLLPQDWIGYMVEIDLGTWMQIRDNMGYD